VLPTHVKVPTGGKRLPCESEVLVSLVEDILWVGFITSRSGTEHQNVSCRKIASCSHKGKVNLFQTTCIKRVKVVNIVHCDINIKNYICISTLEELSTVLLFFENKVQSNFLWGVA